MNIITQRRILHEFQSTGQSVKQNNVLQITAMLEVFNYYAEFAREPEISKCTYFCCRNPFISGTNSLRCKHLISRRNKNCKVDDINHCAKIDFYNI